MTTNSADFVARLEMFIRAVIAEVDSGSDFPQTVHVRENREELIRKLCVCGEPKTPKTIHRLGGTTPIR